MAVVERTVAASAEKVWAVLANGWSYSDWVVGTVHIRDVEQEWPAPGSRIHHKAGPWPLSIHDTSTVVAAEKPRMLHLRPKLWPLGEAEVVITLSQLGSGRTKVRIEEDFRAGPLRWARNKLNDLVMHRRNVESLRRLADIAERQETRPPHASAQ